ncbi:unnamed protein product [Brassicogethes aeneus]|uniref:Tyr recombinase domain-containing protein n=1 Tax=Brassicogethes aeneus TaxID=1431903 RepID=A0A9P0FHL3_BRAAE|nr:unnamed protein product [Brassicogethes aeneus]
MKQVIVKKEPEELVDDSERDISINYDKPSTSSDQEMPSTSGMAIKQKIKKELHDSDNSMDYDESGVKEEPETSTDEDNFDGAKQTKLILEAKYEEFLDKGSKINDGDEECDDSDHGDESENFLYNIKEEGDNSESSVEDNKNYLYIKDEGKDENEAMFETKIEVKYHGVEYNDISAVKSGADSEVVNKNILAKIVLPKVPAKSRKKYKEAFDRYEKWCNEKKIINLTSEKGLLVYFNELSKTQKPSSLWCYYSMLKTEISIKQNVDIKKYVNLIAFLKRKSDGYKPKKSKVLTKKEITKFLLDAGEEKFLCMKVILIIGLAGACRREEITNLLVENVKDEGVCFQIIIPNTKTKVSREFFVTSGNIEGVNLVEVVRKYINLRPKYCDHARFFVGYRAGKCIRQPIGINTIGSVPNLIAQFLQLPNPKEYTGHCFWQSSTSLLADSGADLLTVKRHGGWKSNLVPEGYIETSSENKKRTAMKILGASEDVFPEAENIASTSKDTPSTSTNYVHTQNISSKLLGMSASGINLSNCKDFTVNVYNK